MNQLNKNRLLFLGLFVLGIFAYIYGFSRTFEIVSSVNELQSKKDQYQDTPMIKAALLQKEKGLDTILAKNHINSASIQNELLNLLQRIADEKKIMITSFEKPHIFKVTEENKEVISYQFSLRGDYKSILQTIHDLEQKYNFGNVKHVFFEKLKNYRSGREYLECQILVQRVQ